MSGGVRGDARKRLADSFNAGIGSRSMPAPTPERIAELMAANDRAREDHKAAQSYADHTAARWHATQSALAAALIEHQEKP